MVQHRQLHGPRAGGDHHVPGMEGVHVRADNEVSVCRRDLFDALRMQHTSAVVQRADAQGLHQVADADRAMRLDQQAGPMRQRQRFDLADGRRAIEEATRHALPVQAHRQLGQPTGLLLRVGHLEGAFAHVRHLLVGVALHAGDERVVAVQAVGPDLLQCGVMGALDVRAQHAGRGLRRTGARRLGIEHDHRRAVARQRMGDGTTNQPGTNHEHIGVRR